MTRARRLALALVLLSTAAASQESPSPAARKAAAAALKRDFGRCHLQADLDACYDAIRWNPSEPALIAALADALVRAHRPAEALRDYRRAAELAPNLRGVAAKIAKLEARLSARRTKAGGAALDGAAGKRYSNADPETESH